MARNDSGRLLCNYCLIESHPRANCKIRQRDLSFNINHVVHPLRGYLDKEGVPNYHLDGNGQMARNDSGRPLCNYCLIESHPRVTCKIRRRDLFFNVDQVVHPLKGYLDEKGVPDYHLDGNGRIARTNSGRPLCNYCLSTSHPRKSCKLRQHDLKNGVDHVVHPQKGLLSCDPKRPTTRHPEHLKYRQAYRHRNT